jgi:hypothetical protein
MRLRTILIGVAILIVAFLGASFALQWTTSGPASGGAGAPKLVEVPPLPAVTSTSVVITPTAIALNAIRDALDAQAPRNLTGKRDNPISKLLSNAEIGWTVTRSPLSVSGQSDALALSTVLNGTLRATGQLGAQAGNVIGALGSVLDQNLGKNLQDVAGRTLDQRTDFRGNVTLVSRPALTAGWRLEPNLTAQVALADASMNLAGVKIAVGNEVKPLLDRQINDQVNALQARLRADPFLEQAARREWAKMCRSFPLGTASPGMPNVWLEFRPTRAFAGQPKIDGSAVTLLIGVQAQTRVVPTQTTPDCPFPATLDLVPQTDRGRVNLAVPIDLPFTEVNRLLGIELAGKTFPEDASGPYEATVRSATIAPSGDRLLISLRVKARERASWFGLGAEADVFVWGRPVLDPVPQTLRLTDVTVDVDSGEAFGLLGAAARAALPYLKDAIAAKAVIDLKPFLANAANSIQAALADFRGAGDGVKIDADVTGLRIQGIAFDAKTLRVLAEANGNVKVAVDSLPR